MTSIVQKAENFLQVLEKDAVVAWDIFLKDVTYLSKEAKIISEWVQHADPAVAAHMQDFITKAEAAAAQLAMRGEGGLQNVIALGVDSLEQSAAVMIQRAAGNSPLGVTANALATSSMTFLGTTLENMTTVGFTRAMSALILIAQAADAKANQALPNTGPGPVIVLGNPQQ